MRSTKTAIGLVTRPSSISAASRLASAVVASPPTAVSAQMPRSSSSEVRRGVMR